VAVVTKLVVAVLTYQRPATLARLLERLDAQVSDCQDWAQGRWSAGVLVIDNDPEASARETVSAWPGVTYVHEPIPGIAAARNRALDEAAEARALVFIDDDELPHPGWLVNLVRTYEDEGATAVWGWVEPEYESPPDAFIVAGRFFDRPRRRTGTVVPAAGSGNLLLDMDAIRSWNMRFPEPFGLTGGEDTAFTRSITARGGRIVWCDEAVVTDLVPADRATRAWVLRRAYRVGNVEMRVAIHLAESARARLTVRARYVARGTVRLAAGTARQMLGVVTRRTEWEARGARTAARGRGMLAAVFGSTYVEYRRSAH
jgi:glycosyltransferase involved in cell wall biosynthesis